VSHVALAAVLQMSLLATGADEYKVAYKASQEEGKPLVVLVGAEWCPGCRTMKNSVMPEVKAHGKLDAVAFTQLNTDNQRELSQKMMSGNLIPQLVMYTKTADGWKVDRLVGAQSTAAVEQFIAKGVAETAKNQAVAAISHRDGAEGNKEKAEKK
jgi:thioredoxin-like negative regulator of GroEL